MVEETTIKVLNEFGCKVNAVDIGCHKAAELMYIKPRLKVLSYWIGVDPTNHGVGSMYDKYFEVAVDCVSQETEKTFTEYPAEMGCNSLLPLNTEKITHDKNEYDQKWWMNARIENEHKTRIVKVNSMSNLLKSINFNDVIHFVKIDTQGNDMNAVKSFEKYLDKTYYIQIESVTSHNKDVVMYKGQSLYEDDVEEMKKLGFVQLAMDDYSQGKNAPPEANVLFYNTNLLTL